MDLESLLDFSKVSLSLPHSPLSFVPPLLCSLTHALPPLQSPPYITPPNPFPSYFSFTCLPRTQPFDVSLLDSVVSAAYDPSSPHRSVANTVLMKLQDSPDLWTRVDAILEGAKNANARFFALNVLDKTIRERWKILPEEQR